tara:strand:- start:281 stop:1411 length:1131 start_codon:yes stop_codon:yes gene_type:complete
MKIYVASEYAENDSISLIERFFCFSEFEFVNSVINSDFIFIPVDIGKFYGSKIKHLYKEILNSRNYHKHKLKYIFYSSLDNSWNFPFGGIWLRESVKSNVNSDQSICVPYPTYRQGYAEHDISKYSINFVGSLVTHPVRKKIAEYYYSLDNSNIIMIPRFEYHGHIAGDQNKVKKRNNEMIKMIKNTLITLCPRGAGMNSMRFYESLSFGRIPLLISDGCVLPFENRINYSDIIYRLNENEINEINEIGIFSIDELRKKCQRAYNMFNENFVGQSLSKNLYLELLEKRENKFSFDLNFEQDLTQYFLSHIDGYFSEKEFYSILSVVEFVKSIPCENKSLTNQINNLMYDIKEILNKDIHNYKDQYIGHLESNIIDF